MGICYSGLVACKVVSSVPESALTLAFFSGLVDRKSQEGRGAMLRIVDFLFWLLVLLEGFWSKTVDEDKVL